MKGNCANACAPSTITSMPRSRPIRQIFFTGKIWPVRLVMWQMWITLVLGVIASSIRFAR